LEAVVGSDVSLQLGLSVGFFPRVSPGIQISQARNKIPYLHDLASVRPHAILYYRDILNVVSKAKFHGKQRSKLSAPTQWPPKAGFHVTSGVACATPCPTCLRIPTFSIKWLVRKEVTLHQAK
jgi:hypothetical protein